LTSLQILSSLWVEFAAVKRTVGEADEWIDVRKKNGVLGL